LAAAEIAVELLVLLIKLIVKGLSPTAPGQQAPSNPAEVVRQIQARIEAARLQQPIAPGAGQMGRTSGLNKRQIPAAARQKPPAFKQKKTKRKMPPALPAKVSTAPAVQATVAPPVAPKPPAKPPIYVDAQVLGRWLRPQTLRSQFILTEIFQPPVTLRQTHLL
jgi:hypothetical protein